MYVGSIVDLIGLTNIGKAQKEKHIFLTQSKFDLTKLVYIAQRLSGGYKNSFKFNGQVSLPADCKTKLKNISYEL